MPVNMDPAKKHRRRPADAPIQSGASQAPSGRKQFGEETDEDRHQVVGGRGKEKSVGCHGSHRHGHILGGNQSALRE